jgi:hypothetical protein
MRRNCLLKHCIDRKIEGMGRRGRRRRQLLDDLRGTKRYWKLKAGVLPRSVWRTRFGRGHRPVVRQARWWWWWWWWWRRRRPISRLHEPCIYEKYFLSVGSILLWCILLVLLNLTTERFEDASIWMISSNTKQFQARIGQEIDISCAAWSSDSVRY